MQKQASAATVHLSAEQVDGMKMFKQSGYLQLFSNVANNHAHKLSVFLSLVLSALQIMVTFCMLVVC